MTKTMQALLLIGLFVFTITAQAGVTLSTTVSINSLGHDIATITATSDDAPITSLGINVVGAGNISQVHPMAFETPLMDYNPFMAPPTAPDQDTQALFGTAADNLLVVAGSVDNADMLDVNFTGFQPFMSREVAQVVTNGGDCVCTVGVVAGGVEYTLIATAQGARGGPCSIPEPASLGMLAIASLTMTRRQK